jgi:hypothetical protein
MYFFSFEIEPQFKLKISALGQKIEFILQNAWATLIGLPLAMETISLTKPLSNNHQQASLHQKLYSVCVDSS